MNSVQRWAVLFFLGVFTLLSAARCPEDVADFKVLLQSEQVPAGTALAPYCVDNNAWSVGSAVIGCESDLYAPGDPVAGFLNATEDQVRARVENFWDHRSHLDAPGTLLLLNCEEPIHVRNWSDYNNDPVFQDQIFEAMKMRVEVFREYFPQAIIALGPSIRGQGEGQYLQVILERIEALKRAAEYGVFDPCNCFEPRVFLSHGPDDGPNWVLHNLAMTTQAMDIASDLTNSYGLPLPLCVTSSFLVFNGGSLNDGEVAAEAARLQLAIILTYPNLLTVSWWAGFFDEDTQIPFLETLDACDFVP